MSSLLDKIESLQEKVRQISLKWEDMKAENDRLKDENLRLQEMMSSQNIKSESNGKEEELENLAAVEERHRSEMASLKKELEMNLELLRKYRNGI